VIDRAIQSLADNEPADIRTDANELAARLAAVYGDLPAEAKPMHADNDRDGSLLLVSESGTEEPHSEDRAA
jgi:hypothetical protein